MISDKDKCPLCGKGMLLFFSLRRKACVDCRKEFPWELDKGQQPLIKHQR